MKDKPFLIASLTFGAVGLLLLLISAIIFITKDTALYNNLEILLGMKSGSITTSIVAQLATVCMIPSFIFAYKSLSDDEVY